MNYKTPGVYTEEITKFPPSVAQVETAIPVFVGFTEITQQATTNLLLIPTRITSLLEYEQFFGKANIETNIEVTIADEVNDTDEVLSREVQATFGGGKPDTKHYMYYAMQMYFANGGGPCYICSLGEKFALEEPLAIGEAYTSALDAIAKVDEITLLVFPDAVTENNAGYRAIIELALQQCADLQDRFVIIDPTNSKVSEDISNDIKNIRLTVGNDNLKYGAAYYPYLNTVLPYHYRDQDVTVAHHKGGVIGTGHFDGASLNILNKTYIVTKGAVEDVHYKYAIEFYNASQTPEKTILLDFNGNVVTDIDTGTVIDFSGSTIVIPSFDANETRLIDVNYNGDTQELSTSTSYSDSEGYKVVTESSVADFDPSLDVNSPDLLPLRIELTTTTENKFYNNQLFNEIKQEIKNLTVTLPPSSTIAGVYATVDNARGVWKSPANISLKYIQGPSHLISSAEQEDMNVTTSGKSVNAIRAFAGKGTLVWGGRTLAGNDNEWRYVSVRRFFNMVEESVKKASERYVFENNDANTWLQVRVMIENFLTLQWRAGALQGAKTDDAFFVRVGLGETMTAQDILEGRMIVEIGMAVVRPAEFIILRFSHKLVES